MLRRGQRVRCVAAPYREGPDPCVVNPGDIGTYFTTDGAAQADGIVVNFPHVGGFCCRLEHVEPIEDDDV